jgi:MFS family permease
LWRHRDFTAYWVGQTASEFGTQVTFVALPLLAVLTLHASVGQVGLLRFAEYLPFLILTPLFGVWADRSRRRPLMLGSYVARAILVFSVPALIAFGLLPMPVLLVIVFAIGAGAALFDVCWLSYIPGLVPKDRLVEAMAKCQMSQSTAEVSGPGIGGALVQLLTAPIALVVDGVSYLIGVASLARTRYREPEPAHTDTGRQVWRELYEGLRFAFGQPYIRPTVLTAAIGNFFLLVAETVFLVYAVRDLRLSAGLIGLILTATGAGGLVGAIVSNAATKRWPLGIVLLSTRVACSVGAILLPMASGPTVLAVAVCMASFFLVHGGMATSNVLVASIRQAVTPGYIRGRMNASCRAVVYGALPLGSLTGGILGQTIGLHTALWLAAIGYATSILPILASPIARLGNLPDPS